MILTPHKMLFLLSSGAVIVLIPFLTMPLVEEQSPSPLLVPLVVVFEIIVYFLYVSFRKEITDVLPYIICAVLVALFRFLTSLLGGFYLAVIGHGGVSDNVLRLWAGHPVSVMLQIGAVLLVLPHVIAVTAPGMLTESSRRRLMMMPPAVEEPRSTPAQAGVSEVAPVGGFVRVYSFRELESFFRKIVGLEGFVLFSDEGLIVWKDLQMRLDVDTLIVRYRLFDNDMGRVTKHAGLQTVYRWILQSREHIICHIALKSSFSLLLFFNTQLSLAEVAAKIDLLSRTAQELLNTRYGASWAA
jgi:hypothetical protein